MASQKIVFPGECQRAEARPSKVCHVYSKLGNAKQSSKSATPGAIVVTGPKTEADLCEQAIRHELSRLLESPIFVQSNRLGRFLRFTIETTLAGQAEVLKEYLIGTEVYDRKPPYHPSEDSIVRSEARRLRSKLKEYYESVGKDDPVFIYYRPGTYVPVFRHRESKDIDRTRTSITPSEPISEGRAISVAVLPFVDVSRSRSELCGVCAQIVTDSLIHELVRTEGFRVSSLCATAPLAAQALDLLSLARKLDLQYLFEGAVHELNNHLLITSRVVKADGFLLSSERFEMEPDTSGFLKISEQIASALIDRVSTHESVSDQVGHGELQEGERSKRRRSPI
jgi:TolB-like protein